MALVVLHPAFIAQMYAQYGPASSLPGLQEAGLALAELRQVEHVRSEALEVLKQTLQDLDRAEERAHNALRLLRAAE